MEAIMEPGSIIAVNDPPLLKPLKILHITTTDPAGSVYNMIRAINTHTPHRARLFSNMRIQSFNFPTDISDIFDTGDELEALLNESDIFHFHKVIEEDMEIEFALENMGINKLFSVKDFIEVNGKKKKLIYHIHGHASERNFPKERAEIYKEKNAMVLAVTPDLEEMYKNYYDNVHYFPNCVPINDVRYLPRASDKMLPWGKLDNGDPFYAYIVAQSPTNTILKDVDLIKDVVERIGKDLPIRYVQIWNADQDYALRHKRNAHIVFDHMQGYYGLSSLEGLSMGKPVIAALSPYTMNAICKFFDIDRAKIPWCVTPDSLAVEKMIKDLIADEAWRKDVGVRSREFMENIWSDKILAKRLVKVYEQL